MKTKTFIRKVGFGLSPDEPLPVNPLDWAKSEMAPTLEINIAL